MKQKRKISEIAVIDNIEMTLAPILHLIVITVWIIFK